MLNKRADKLELIRIAEAVALEKSIDKELIISSMETGIAKAAKSKFGQDNEIKVSINRSNGDIEIFRKLIVAENPENSNIEIKLEDAINLDDNNKNKSYFEIIFSTIVKISENVKEKKELEKIILCDVQNDIYPDIEKTFLNLINDSGYPGIKFEKKIDFEKLYNQKFN